MRRLRTSLLAAPLALSALAVLGVRPAAAQTFAAAPPAVLDSARVLSVTVVGTSSEAMKSAVVQASGLEVGQSLRLPDDPAIGEALRRVQRLNQFSDVQIVEQGREGTGVRLAIAVTEAPRIADVVIRGVKDDEKTALQARLPFVRGTRLAQTDLREAASVVEGYFHSEGYLGATATVSRVPVQNGVNVVVQVAKGQRSRVAAFEVEGNRAISDREIVGRIKKTRPRDWRLWIRDSYRPQLFEEDKARILDLYRRRGYYDARIVSDTARVVMRGGRPEAVVSITVDEGARYHVRNVAFEGNTRYTDEQLQRVVGVGEGDVFNQPGIEENLFGNKAQSHVGALYQNQGYLRFNVEPTYTVAAGDSVDLHFDVFEGDVYDFGTITVAGNTKTKEHVIRRELYTIPGQTFSREAIMESLRRLQQLNYFNAESLGRGPDIQPNDRTRTVDMTYTLEEVGSDQLELSGTYSGGIGLILQLGVTFNNFSAQNLFDKNAWRPVPMGDGQQLAIRVQTAGTRYQQYSLSFTEPWFRGRPTPIGFSTSYSRYDQDFYNRTTSANESNLITIFSGRGFFNRRLRWPDDKFDLSTGVGYRRYFFEQPQVDLPAGTTNEITAELGLSRNSLNNPIFPTQGALTRLTLDVAPPFPGFEQYHKWGLSTQWHAPLAQKLTFSLGAQYGYIGSLTGADVRFQRFLLGGSPLDAQGRVAGQSFIGKDVIFARGYPSQALGPRRNLVQSDGSILYDTPVGGRILNKYTSEIRWLAVQSAQLQAAPYLFADAMNTWDRFATYNPASLYRSAGLGVRLFLPILGMVELTYGYHFDRFVPVPGRTAAGEDGSPGWLFQFSLGQGFNQ